MKRIRLGICMMEPEYRERFCGCLMNHYKEQLELHIFTEVQALIQAEQVLDLLLLSGFEEWLFPPVEKPVMYLCDSQEELWCREVEGVIFLDKYQEVNQIVDQIMQQIGDEIRCVKEDRVLKRSFRLFCVYALSETEYQLPFAVTLASVLGDRERILLVDLQENSGLRQLFGEVEESCLEDLLVMAETDKWAQSRIISSIGHLDHVDYVYPVTNSECLCEMSVSTYRKLLEMLADQMGYDGIVINLGSRFAGFFSLLDSCQEFYFLKGRSGLGRWREKEFMEEFERHRGDGPDSSLREIELPKMTTSAISCERLVEQWKWNEFGDSIRRMLSKGATHG